MVEMRVSIVVGVGRGSAVGAVTGREWPTWDRNEHTLERQAPWKRSMQASIRRRKWQSKYSAVPQRLSRERRTNSPPGLAAAPCDFLHIARQEGFRRLCRHCKRHARGGGVCTTASGGQQLICARGGRVACDKRFPPPDPSYRLATWGGSWGI